MIVYFLVLIHFTICPQNLKQEPIFTFSFFLLPWIICTIHLHFTSDRTICGILTIALSTYRLNSDKYFDFLFPFCCLFIFPRQIDMSIDIYIHSLWVLYAFRLNIPLIRVIKSVSITNMHSKYVDILSE